MDRQHYRDIKSRAHGAMQAILAVATAQGRAPTVEEQATFDGHKATILDADRAIQMMDDSDAIGAQLNAVAPSRIGAPSITAPPAKKEFESLGEFLSVVRFNRNDQRLQAAQNMGSGSAGGFMVPREFSSSLLQVEPGEALVRPRATVIGAGTAPDAGIDMPALDQRGDTSNIYGGVTVSWIAEGAPKPPTAAKFLQVSLDPKEVAATIPVTDKLLRNWSGSETVLEQLLRGALIQSEDLAFLSGDGVGKPTGFLHALNTGAITVPRSAAGKITRLDTLMMEQSAHGRNLVYVGSRTAKTQVSQLKDEAGQNIWRDAAGPVPATLNGIPYVTHDALPKLGVKGDLVLVDLSYYLVKDGFGIAVAISEHEQFSNNTTIIKAFTNVDGKSWLTKPLKTAGGDDISPFVLLGVPG